MLYNVVMVKTFDLRQLNDMAAKEVIDKIQHEGYSLLKSLGADDLRQEMVTVGSACNVALNYVYKGGASGKARKGPAAARKKMVKMLKRVAPGDYDGFPKDSKHGMVVAFNHPSLGEILRILMMKMDVMGSRPMLFPVNLPWYEALAKNYERIKGLGIIITPTITPTTWGKMKLKKGTLEHEAGARLKREFLELYTRLSVEALKKGGVIFVAPSATRQAAVFASKKVYEREEPIIPTISMLICEIFKDPEMECDLLPMAILPPEGYKRGLNILKKYALLPGEMIAAEEIRKKYYKKRAERLPELDYEVHRRIAEKLPREMWY